MTRAYVPFMVCRGFLADISALLGNESSLPSTFVAVDAFPPRLSRLRPSFDGSCGTARRSLFCWAFGTSSLVLGSTADFHRGAQQNSSGKIHRFRHHPVATTATRIRTDLGLRCWTPTHPPGQPYGASLSLETVTHLRLPPDLPSQAPRRLHPSAAARVFPSKALVSSVSGSLRQGPGFGLAPPICEPCRSHVFDVRYAHLEDPPLYPGLRWGSAPYPAPNSRTLYEP
jgi:hypothetical protein